MRNALVLSFLMMGCAATQGVKTAEPLKATAPQTEEDIAPEITEFFKQNFPQLLPLKWRNLAGGAPGEFFLISEPITEAQKDANQSVRAIGKDFKNDGVMNVSDIQTFGVNASHQRDRSISEDLFVEDMDEVYWKITRTFSIQGSRRIPDPRRDDLIHERFIQNQRRVLSYHVRKSEGREALVDKVRDNLPPVPKTSLMRNTIQL